MTLTDLITRLENAQGPDELLDGEISDAFGIDRRECCGSGVDVFRGYDEPPDQECCGNPIETRPLPYTGSLDAAMQLVKPGTLWSVGRMKEDPFACIIVPQPDGRYVGGYFQAHAKTPAIALTIACLKAIAADKERA